MLQSDQQSQRDPSVQLDQLVLTILEILDHLEAHLLLLHQVALANLDLLVVQLDPEYLNLQVDLEDHSHQAFQAYLDFLVVLQAQ